MANCSFCNKIIPPGTGKVFVQNTGKILYFDSPKCEKNMLKLRRKSSKLKWTGFFKKGKK